MKLIISFLCALILSACATQGNQTIKEETQSSVSTKVMEGKTTKAEVRQLFGDPMSTTFTDSGNEIYKYEFIDSQAKAINFIPFVNLFKSGMEGTKKTLTILFDSQGIVKKYSMDASKYETNTGIIKQ